MIIVKEKDYLEGLDEEIKEKYLEGIKRLDIGEYEQARDILMEVIDKESGFVPAFNKLGIIYIYIKELEKAKEWLNRALELDNEFAPAITNLGSIKREKGDLATAKEFYQKAIEVDPEYGAAYNNLGVIYREEGKFKESVKYLKKANKLNSYSIDLSKKRPFYREPGCLVPLAIAIILLIFLYILFK